MSEQKFTPGPWKFEVNPATHDVKLMSGAFMRPFVMGFARYGLQGAQPMFPVNGCMVEASEIATPEPGREHHAGWHRIIDHPNARLIAAAPELLGACIEAAEELRLDPTKRTCYNVAAMLDEVAAKARGGVIRS